VLPGAVLVDLACSTVIMSDDTTGRELLVVLVSLLLSCTRYLTSDCPVVTVHQATVVT